MRRTLLLVIFVSSFMFISTSVFAISYNGLGIQPAPEIDPFYQYEQDETFNGIIFPDYNPSGFTLLQEDSSKLPTLAAIFFNIFPSFGIGSFMQGNIGGGLVQLFVEGIPVLGGISLILAGGESGNIGGLLLGSIFGIMLIGGGVVIGWIIGIIAPLIYSASHSNGGNNTGLIFTGDGIKFGFYF